MQYHSDAGVVLSSTFLAEWLRRETGFHMGFGIGQNFPYLEGSLSVSAVLQTRLRSFLWYIDYIILGLHLSRLSLPFFILRIDMRLSEFPLVQSFVAWPLTRRSSGELFLPCPSSCSCCKE